MIEFTAQQEPVHHITVTHGSERTHFWYFLSAPDAKPFDKIRDGKLVEQLHVEGGKLDIGSHTILTSQTGHKYNLGRMDAKNYTVQSLSNP